MVGREQLYAVGYTRHAIQTRLRNGRLHRISRGVYAVGHTNLSLKGRWTGAVLACGPGAALSHRDAATVHGLLTVGSGAIDVTSPSRRHVDGIRCHAARALHPRDVAVIDGIPVTSLERTLLDLAEASPPRQLHRALEQAQREDKLDRRRIEAMIVRNPGRHGIKALRGAVAELQDDPAWTQSELERQFRELSESRGLPRPAMNQYVEGELVDAFWRDHHLVVEVDGWRFHKTRRSFENDRRKDAKLVEAGWRVVRFTHHRVFHEPDGVAITLSRLLRAGPWPPPARSGP